MPTAVLTRPTRSELALTWELARESAARHHHRVESTEARAHVLCGEGCGWWPCSPWQNATDTMRHMQDAQSDLNAGQRAASTRNVEPVPVSPGQGVPCEANNDPAARLIGRGRPDHPGRLALAGRRG